MELGGTLSEENELYEGIPSTTGRGPLAPTPTAWPLFLFGFIGANGAQVTSIVTPYGVMAMASTGPTLIPSTTLIRYQRLALAKLRTETFIVYVSDGRGGSPREITVTITGTNDRPRTSPSPTPRRASRRHSLRGGTFAVQEFGSDSGQEPDVSHRRRQHTPAADGTSLPTVPTPPQAARGRHVQYGLRHADFDPPHGQDPCVNNASDKVQRVNAGETKAVETLK